MAGLTAAALLAHRGQQVLVLEQNWLPGGCASSYSRKGFVFESGATTLVGLDQGMPLRHLLDTIGIELPLRSLAIPMQELLSGRNLPDDGRYLLICSRGKRSLATCLTLRERGIRDVYSLRGGAQALSEAQGRN